MQISLQNYNRKYCCIRSEKIPNLLLNFRDCSTNEWNGQYIRQLGFYVAVNNLKLIGLGFSRW